MNPEIWRYVFDAIEDPVFLHDTQFRVLLANRAYCREAGMSEVQALGKPYWTVFPRGAGPLPGCQDAENEKGHTGSQEEVRVGEKLFFSRGYTVRDDQGKSLYSLHILSDISAQSQAEVALAESNERFRRATETARDAIVILDGESGAVTAWNPAAEAMFGYGKEEVVGRVLTDFLLPPRFRAAMTKGMAHFATTGAGAVIGKTQELLALHKDGTEFPIELSLSAAQIHGKWFATGIARDISERKQAEESLKNMAAKFRTVFESSSDAIILLDQKVFFDCNQAALRTFGYASRDDFINKQLSHIFPPTQPGGKDSMSLSNEHIATAFQKGSNQFEWIYRRLDGTEFPAEVVLTAMELDGKPMLQGTVRDITERKLGQEALVRKERYYRKMIEGGSDVFFLIDRAEILLYCSESGKQLTGWETADVLGKPITDYVSAESLPQVRSAIAETVAKPDQLVRVEVRMLRKDGPPVEVEALAKNLLDDPDVAGIVMTVRDISERKRAEEKNLLLTRMYRTISRGNKVLVHAVDEVKLAREMCQVLVEEGGFRAAWVGYAEQGADKRIRPIAVAGAEHNEIAGMNLTWEDNEQGHEPTSIAVRTGNVVVSQDILNDPLWAPWRDQAIQRGYAAAATFPLKANDRVLGALDIYGAEADVFVPDVLELLAELAGDIAFGISNLRSRADRLNILEKLETSLDHAVTAIAATVEMRDPYTAGHQRRVAKLAAAIATEMGLSADQVQGLHMACVVHDIGKIHVPAEILSNPGKLTDAELQIIRTHSKTGWEILKGIDFPWPVAEIVYQHHEKLDGSGYPRGLKGDGILLEARILAVADVVEAMTSHRPYRPGFGVFPALQEISQQKGKLFDAAAVEACLRLFMEKNFEW